MNIEPDTNTPEDIKAVEDFPSTLLLLRLYRFGAILSLLLGISSDPNSTRGQGCFLIAFCCALVGFWIYALSSFEEEPLD